MALITVSGFVLENPRTAWSSYRHYQTGVRGTVEIESEWTAKRRGWKLPESMQDRQSGSSSPVPES